MVPPMIGHSFKLGQVVYLSVIVWKMRQLYLQEDGVFPIKLVKQAGNLVQFARTTQMAPRPSQAQVLDLVQLCVEIMIRVQITH